MRRLIGKLPVTCQFCSASFQKADLKFHLQNCDQKPFKCEFTKCSFKCKGKESLWDHLSDMHREFLIRNYGKLLNDSSEAEEGPDRNGDLNFIHLSDPLGAKRNFRGVRVHLGSTGKYYCGERVLNCLCCNGRCGPNIGCNCVDCMELDIRARKLSRGYLVNKQGTICKVFEGVKVYCGCRNEEIICGPNSSQQCENCSCLEEILDKYRILL